MQPTGAPETVVVVPIRSFDDAKSRLAAVMSPAERRALARAMAATVVTAAVDLPVVVVTDDPEVVGWTETVGARALSVGVAGLNPAVHAALAALADEGVGRVVIAHADLPLARDLRVVRGAAVAIAPDRRADGSNVLSVPTDAGFRFAYGPGSFGRHLDEAGRCGLDATVVDEPTLALDIDDPDDLPDDWRRWLDEPVAGRRAR